MCLDRAYGFVPLPVKLQNMLVERSGSASLLPVTICPRLEDKNASPCSVDWIVAPGGRNPQLQMRLCSWEPYDICSTASTAFFSVRLQIHIRNISFFVLLMKIATFNKWCPKINPGHRPGIRVLRLYPRPNKTQWRDIWVSARDFHGSRKMRCTAEGSPRYYGVFGARFCLQ